MEPNLEGFNRSIPKLKEMIELFFDQRVFEFLKKELETISSNIKVPDLKYIEMLQAANELDLLETLLKDFLKSYQFKLS